MQFFCPYANCKKSAKVLDPKRRNKQILEIVQALAVNEKNLPLLKKWKIVKSCFHKNRFQLYKSIKNHPNVKLWKKDSAYLLLYGLYLCQEYQEKTGKRHKCKDILFDYFYVPQIKSDYIFKHNLKHMSPDFCKEHQKILLEKDKEYYSKYF
jgi:hypothetical protein